MAIARSPRPQRVLAKSAAMAMVNDVINPADQSSATKSADALALRNPGGRPPRDCTEGMGTTNSCGAGTDRRLRIHRRDNARPYTEALVQEHGPAKANTVPTGFGIAHADGSEVE